MTRKDYEIIATALAQAWAESSVPEAHGVKKAIEHVTHALQVDNSRFQPARFMKYIQHQCGMIRE